MSKLLVWRKEWSSGIEPLDDDHRALIDRYSDIVLHFCPEATVRGTGHGDALLAALTELGEAARRHFQRTETFMTALGYKGIAAHQAENAVMMAEYTKLLQEWREDGLQVFDDAAQTIVREWLLAHILGTDRELTAHYLQLSGHRDQAAQQAPFPRSQPLSRFAHRAGGVAGREEQLGSQLPLRPRGGG